MTKHGIPPMRGLLLLLAIGCSLVLVSCDNPVLQKVQAAVRAGNKVPSPEISPNGGTYTDPQAVTLSSSLTGARIRYTTDGSDPATSGTATVYSGSFTLYSGCTIKAVAGIDGDNWSSSAEAAFVFAYSNRLDPSFNTAKHCGFTKFSGDSEFYIWTWNAAALQSDGKIVTLGSGRIDDPLDENNPFGGPCIARFTGSGDLDASFGTGGYVFLQDSTYKYCECLAVAVDDQDRIYFQGTKSADKGWSAAKGFVGRLLPNGTLDTSYGDQGVFLSPKTTSDHQCWGSHQLALDATNHVAYFSAGDYIHRLTAKGLLDTSFGTSGAMSISDSFPTTGGSAIGLSLVTSGSQSGSIGVLCNYGNPITTWGLFCLRPTGVPYSASLVMGSIFDGTTQSFACDGVFSSDMDIYVVGKTQPSMGDGAFIAAKHRYSDGNIDPSWGETPGKGSLYNYNNLEASSFCAALLADGCLLQGGFSMVGSVRYWTILRYSAAGKLLSSLVDTGVIGKGLVGAIVVQPDGRYIAVGSAGGATIARYWP